MTTITLRRGLDGWLATWSGDDAARVRGLMGSATVPTAFTAVACADSVLREIARLNPECRVVLA